MGLHGVSAPPAHHLVAGPYVAWCGVAWHWWLTWEPSSVLTLAGRICLLFPPCSYSCLSWQIPNGKEEQAGFLLPALNASMVIESPACGPAAMLLLGRLYLMFLLFKLLLDLQLCYMACSDFMADIMYVSQSFLCLLLTRKS